MIATIENAILARLEAAGETGQLGYRFRTLETYPDDWDEYLGTKGKINAPAAWVTNAGWRSIADEQAVEMLFGVVVMAESLRDEQATRHGRPGDERETGSYRLAVDVTLLFADQDLGLDIGGFEVGQLRFVARLAALKERKVSMLAVELRTRVPVASLRPPFDDNAIGDFITAHVNWDIPPLGDVDASPGVPGIQIPADASADATDHLTVRADDD
ncbi:DUF1834 family protein [Sphingomonas naphthae]|uniref:DUF1834 family protein n=1 Tax=Sphingomonas naphthae TaxID=1813468 RepID=A0ABY7TGW7_9SPHN|nr:phage protein Gp37 [Sphingomonas naphthae]WCT72056.1 DUF1834 family protein [Sphingomonas naphthae]